MTEQRKNLLTNLATGLVVAVMVFGFGWDPEKGIFHQLCDATFVAAVILLGIGGLKFARNGGTFDIMAYGIGSAIRMTFPWLLKDRKDADFAAYKERKREVRQSARPELLAGSVYLVLALIFLALYSL